MKCFFTRLDLLLKKDWVGIVHDPENSHHFFKNKNLLEHKQFKESLPFCKGLFCMSKNVKTWIQTTLQPDFFVDVLYHPLSHKINVQWNYDSYKQNKKIYQIGNWLRKTYSIYQLETSCEKNMLPYNKRQVNELIYFLKRDKVHLHKKDISSVNHIRYINDEQYNNIFHKSIIFLNLYSSTCNNVIMEAITSNCPIVINRLEPIEDYLGKDYPLFYDTLREASLLIENDEMIKEAHNYLQKMDRSRFTINNMIEMINKSLIMLQ